MAFGFVWLLTTDDGDWWRISRVRLVVAALESCWAALGFVWFLPRLRLEQFLGSFRFSAKASGARMRMVGSGPCCCGFPDGTGSEHDGGLVIGVARPTCDYHSRLREPGLAVRQAAETKLDGHPRGLVNALQFHRSPESTRFDHLRICDGARNSAATNSFS